MSPKPRLLTVNVGARLIRSFCLAGAAIACFIQAPTGRAQTPYAYTVVHTYTAAGHFPPSINSTGLVAFSVNGTVYRGDGTTPLETIGGSIGTGHVSINDAGAIAFRGTAGSWTTIAVAQPGAAATILAQGNATWPFVDQPSINNSGDVVFRVTASVTNAIVRGSAFDLVAGPGDSVPGATIANAHGPIVNDAGDVGFTATVSSGPVGIFRTDNGTFLRMGDASATGSVTFAMNDAGVVAFWRQQSNPVTEQRIVTSDGVTETTMAVSSSGFVPQPHRVAINNAGIVVFQATSGTGLKRVVVSDGVHLSTVLSPGATIPGLGTVLDTWISHEAINDLNQIAIRVDYDDGSGVTKYAVVRADPVNRPPDAGDSTAATDEDIPVSGTLIGTDADNQTLSFAIGTNGTLGSAAVTDAATGAFTYTPKPNAYGTDTFTFVVSDGIISSAPATVTVTIDPVNDPPSAAGGVIATAEDVPHSGTLSASDVEGDPLAFAIASNGALGTAVVTDAATGAFTYTPHANVSGSDTFTYQVTDSGGLTSGAPVSVSIAAVDDAPLATNGVGTVAAGDTLSGALTATDAEGDAMTFSLPSQPANGTVVLDDAATGAFTYTPDAGFTGYDPFAFDVSPSGGGAGTTGTFMMFVVAASPQWPGQTVRTTVATGGGQLNGFRATASADGRFISFTQGGLSASFVHDRLTLQTARVDVSSTGTLGNGSTDMTSISSDGRHVAFMSGSTNLVTGDGNSALDIFVRDVQTGLTARVSVASDGTEANGHSLAPAISADGRYVAFVSRATNLVPGDSNNREDIFLHDRATQRTTRVSVGPGGAEAPLGIVCAVSSDGQLPCVSIDATGRFIAFASFSNLVSDDTNTRLDAFVHDALTGQTSRVSVGTGGVQSVQGGEFPSISPDGRFVVFSSSSSTLVPGDTNSATDIFLHDRVTAHTSRVSLGEDGAEANADSQWPSVSAGGRFITFLSNASNLVDSDANGARDAFVRDVVTGRTRRINVADDGTVSNQHPRNVPRMTADGRFALFSSDATNLVTNDTNGASDVFVVGGVSVTPVSHTIGRSGGVGSSDVTFVYPGTTWGATSQAPWITITGQSSTNGNGTVSFDVAPNSGAPRSGTLTVALQTVTVDQAGNTPPAPVPDTASTPEDTAVDIDLTANDSDADGDTIFVVVTTVTQQGATVAILNDSTVRYTPPLNFYGSDQFQYAIRDAVGAQSSLSTVTVTVTPVNDTPQVIGPDVATTAEDTPVTIRPKDNDVDVDGDTFSIVGFTQPAHGRLTQPGTATLVYAPAPNFHGVDSFIYTIGDGAGATASGPVTVTVTPVNDAPVADAQSVRVVEDLPRAITLTGFDRDANDTVSFSVTTSPAHGVLDGTAPALVYTPAQDYNGPDSFTFTVTDGAGATTTAAVTLTVDPRAWLPIGPDGARIQTLAMVRNTPGAPIVYAGAANAGVFQSRDLGASWVPTSSGLTMRDVRDLAIDPVNPLVIYAGATGGLFKSVDGGATWTASHSGLIPTGSLMRVTAVAIDSTNPTVLYAGTEGSGLSKSTNAGASWTAINTGLTNNIIRAVIVDPTQPSRVFAATSGGMFRSTNGGASWSPVNTGLSGLVITALAMSPSDPSVLLAGVNHTQQVFRTSNGGDNWTVSNTGIPATGVVSSNFSFDTSQPGSVYAATNGQIYRSLDGGVSWAFFGQGLPNATTPDILANVDGAGLLMAAHGAGAFVRTAGATDWTERSAGLRGVWANSLASPAAAPVNLLAGTTGAGVFASTDNGVSWQPRRTGLNRMDVSTVGVDPAVPDNVYVATFSGVSRSTNGGTTWNFAFNHLVNALAVHPTTSTVYAGGDGFFRSTNLGASFTLTGLNGLVVTEVRVSPSGQLYAGTGNGGVHTSTDDGTTWTTINSGLGNLQISALAFGWAPQAVAYAGTQAGLYRFSFGSQTWAATHLTPAIRAIAIDPIDSRIAFAATAAGIFRTEDNGLNWSPIHTGLDGASVRDLIVTSARQVFAATDGGGVLQFQESPNDPPEVIGPDLATTTEDTPVTVRPADNDRDVDGDTFTIVAVIQPAHGTVTQPGTHTLIYTPAANFHGTDSFTYIISDGSGATDRGDVSVTVTPVNDPPVTVGPDTATTFEDIAVQIRPADNDVDADGPIGQFQITAVTQPANGTVTQPGTHTLIYTPAANFNGADSFTYTITDLAGATAAGTVSVIVTPVNDAPDVLGPDTAVTAEDTAVTIRPADNDRDVDGDTFTIVSVVQPAHGTVSQPGTHTLVYTPAADFNGSDSFTYVISDGSGATDQGVVTVTVTPVNDPPVAVGPDSATTAEDMAVEIRPADNDTDADGPIGQFQITAVTQPAHGGVMQTGTHTLVYTPVANFHGADTFSYTITDLAGVTATAAVHVTVTAVNDPPIVVGPDTATTAEDTAVDIRPADNDLDVDGPIGQFVISAVTQPAHGSVMQPGTHTLRYTPAANVHGQDSFTYTITDTGGATATGTVTVTVTPVNDPPASLDGEVFTQEDAAVDGTLTASDVDVVDGDVLTFSVVANGAKGDVAIDSATGAFVYTPRANENGTDTFTFRTEDSTGLVSNVAIVQVHITAINDAPIAESAATGAPKGSPIASTVVATDVDGDALAYVLVAPPAQGTAVVNADGSYTYQSTTNASGLDQFTFRARDASLADSNVATVSITILSNNGAPVADDGVLTTDEDVAAFGTLSATGQPGHPLTFVVASSPAKGVVNLSAATGDFTYTPHANVSGGDSFSFRARDGSLTSNLATVAVTIAAVNDDPVASVGTLTVLEDRNENGMLIGTDVDGQTLMFAILDQPSKGTVTITNSATGRYTYEPNANATGADVFSFTVNDGVSASLPVPVNVTITPENDVPVAQDAAFSTPVATTLVGVMPALDADGDTLVYEVTRAPRRGTLSFDPATGAFTYQPNAGFSGQDDFTFRVFDGIRNSQRATVTIAVVP